MPSILAQGVQIISDARALPEVLNALSALAERECPGAIAGFTLVDSGGLFVKEAVFPSLPSAFQESLANITLSVPYTGSCAEAICTGVEVTSLDILADERFDPKWRDICLRYGISSLRSRPIMRHGEAPQGTFVLCYKQANPPAECWNERLMQEIADLAYEAIRLYRAGMLAHSPTDLASSTERMT
jgi:hypothetical protein